MNKWIFAAAALLILGIAAGFAVLLGQGSPMKDTGKDAQQEPIVTEEELRPRYAENTVTTVRGMTLSELQAELILANDGIRTYSIDMQTHMDMAVGDEEKAEDISSQGAFDRNSHVLSVSSTSTDVNLASDMVATGGYLYTMTQGVWVRMPMDDDTWAQNDQIHKLIELMLSGTVEQLDDETIGSETFYVIRIKPSHSTLVAQALREQEQSNLYSRDIDFDDIIHDYSGTLYVNKDTLLIERSYEEILMVMNKDNMGSGNYKEEELSTMMTVQSMFSDFGKSVSVSLPREAKGAIDI